MSSILDALKKSERERSLGRELIFRSAAQESPRGLTGLAVVALATLLLVAVIVTLWFSLRPPESEPEPAVTLPAVSDDNATAAPIVRAVTARELEDQARSATRPVATPKAPAPVTSVAPVLPTGTAPWLSSLPESFRMSLPPLEVNIHVYSPDESQRILYLNNRQVRQGERIQAGVLVEEIAQDGVVLRFRGQRFKLPRPS